jgi:hypothetical protein
MRFSRAMIFFGAVCIALETTLIRFILHLLRIPKYALFKNENRRLIIIGNQKETERVEQLLRQTRINPEFLGIVGYDDQQKENENSNFLGTFRQLKEIIQIYRINEIIFCTGDISSQKIIDYMIDLQKYNVDYKIAPSESIAIIGSNSIHTSGDLYTIHLNTLSKPEYRRKKTLLDTGLSLGLLLTAPVSCFIVKRPWQFIKNCFSVLFGKKSWVGFYSYDNKKDTLPTIKRGILNPTDIFPNENLSPELCERLDLRYAKDYTIYQDLDIIFRGFKNLGRTS